MIQLLAPPVPPSRRSAVPFSAPTILETRVITGTGGGPDKTILNTPRFLEPCGYRTLCAFFHPPDDPGFGSICKKAEAARAPIVSVHDRGPFDVSIIRRTLDLCRRENVVAWHGHDYKSNLLGLVVNRYHPMRLITTVHGWAEKSFKSSIYFRIDRWCLPRYEKVICVSPDLHEAAIKAGVPEDRAILIENGIDLPHYARTQTIAQAKRHYGVPEDRLLIAAVGRLAPEKNFTMFIRAAAQLLNEGHDLSVAIAGDGHSQADLQAEIDRTGHADRIRLLGFVADPRPLYEAADIYALSSDREGLPNVLLEAMSYGVPVLSTAVAGVPRLIQNDQNGLLVPMKDQAAFTGALRQLVAGPELRKRLGQAGYETIESRYTFQARMDKIAQVYESMNIPRANLV